MTGDQLIRIMTHATELLKAATAAYYDRAGKSEHEQRLRYHLHKINAIFREPK